jgi:membrane-bound lytic murein transglycosylase D
VRVPLWTFSALLLLLAVLSSGVACGDGSKSNSQANRNNVPSATLPSTLPAPIIVSGTPKAVQGQRYVVQSGDSPSSIAAKYGITADELMAANGITDPTSLITGVELVIPSAQQGQAPAPTATPLAPTQGPTAQPATGQPPATPSSGRQTYVVRDGDIPETIAAQFGITADQLMAANGITDPTSLQVGQELVIPTPAPAQ